MVYWAKKQVQEGECQIPFLNKSSASDAAITLCNTTAVVNETVREVDEIYSIFRLDFEVRAMQTEINRMYYYNYAIGHAACN